ncbi:phosphoglucomutase/phosphomannomutase PgmG [Dongia rigui]|uniref:Phosphomannomutase/phosphoglucomutase n=1 Tax=Dongia rigui TaxID=940149 RepID=A0ABU5E3N5_9PROT|nr:phosphomannomutase/phosphoglucomutase [Dongia rigui]MDY0873800.1 phosphomannomutase/phosphoglucomutase [Dongia rigui]
MLSSIFREYDIRGIVGDTLTVEIAQGIGRAFGSMIADTGLAAPRICIGCDGRLSSPALKAAVVAGLTASGAEVIDVGLGPTPMLYFAVNHLVADAGIMITGSHNPPSHNGFKMMIGRKPFYGAQIQELGQRIASGKLGQGRGSARTLDVMDTYVSRLLADAGDFSGMAIGWDAGNGAAGDAMKALTARLGGRHVLLNERIDGTFPAHHPDPTEPHNLVQLQQAVIDQKLDLGIAFDGDGDRIGAIDARGRIVSGDQLLAILAKEVLSDRPGATIIADVKASQTLFDEVARLGGKPLMWRTGHSLIKTKMAETNCPLAGEMSGHIFFADRYFGYDDALYAAVRLLGAIKRSGGSLAALRDALPAAVNTPEIRIDCPEERKFAVVAEVRDRLQARGASFNDIDGVRVQNGSGWWLLRASNTQAILVGRAEAADAKALAAQMAELRSELALSGVTLP